MRQKLIISLFTICLFILVDQANGHGRLTDPPGRSTAWRFGFGTPINFNDHQLFCGGKEVQKRNDGKCGICGDPFNGPLENEVPNGKYAKNLVIVRKYKAGQKMNAVLQITVNHHGYFVFKICPAQNEKKEVTQECLDKQQLKVLNSDSKDKYMVKTTGPGNFTVNLELPQGITCKRCVFQWTWTAGNDWGICKNGTGALGCGPQETFRACADISID